MNIDTNKLNELFETFKQIDDYRVIKYKYCECIQRIIYLCLKYRYCYQIRLTQKEEWVKEIYNLLIVYCIGIIDRNNEDNIEFLYDSKELQNIYNDIVHFMNLQGYHDIPDDLYKLFTRDNMCTLKDDTYINHLKDFWLIKYARGKRIKECIY